MKIAIKSLGKYWGKALAIFALKCLLLWARKPGAGPRSDLDPKAAMITSALAGLATGRKNSFIEQTFRFTKSMIEIVVTQNLEKAMRVLKRKLIREGVFKELKTRRFYEKPSEKKKRKNKEATKKRRKEVDRQKRFGGF